MSYKPELRDVFLIQCYKQLEHLMMCHTRQKLTHDQELAVMQAASLMCKAAFLPVAIPDVQAPQYSTGGTPFGPEGPFHK